MPETRTIYLGGHVAMPLRATRGYGRAKPKAVACGVASDRVYTVLRLPGERVSSYLTVSLLLSPAPKRRGGRPVSVALSLGSPPAVVIRYPCPVKPGLSSRQYLSAQCRAALPDGRCIYYTISGVNFSRAADAQPSSPRAFTSSAASFDADSMSPRETISAGSP